MTMSLLRALVGAVAVASVRGLLVPGGSSRRRPAAVVFSVSGSTDTSSPGCRRSATAPARTDAAAAPGPARATDDAGPYGPLLAWIRRFPGAYVHPALSVDADSPCGHGGGASVSRPVSAGDMLLSVPLGACPCAGDALDDAELGPALRKIVADSGGHVGTGAGTVALAGQLALRSLQDGGGGDGAFGPYLRTLPLGRPGGPAPSQEHVLWWTDGEVDAVLGGTDAHGEATAIRAEVDLAVRVLRPLIRNALRKKFTSPLDALAGLFGRTTPAADAALPSDAAVDDAVRGSFVAVLSRGFEDTTRDRARGVTLRPLVDMLQHGGRGTNVRHGIRDGVAFVVEARTELGAGTELLNAYMEKEEAHHFFVLYGFVPEGATDGSGVREAICKRA